jgi:broad specificity phosphatase PhoE
MADEKKDQVVAYVLRHGDTAMNDQNRYRGQTNAPLNDKGKNDAKEVAKFFADKQIGQAFSSPLARATDTAKEVLKDKGIKATKDRRLLPLDAGKFTGMKKDDAKADMKYYHDHTDERIPGGESIDGMHKRVRPALFKAFRAGLRSGKPSLVSAHSSVIHSLGAILHEDHKAALVEPGGVVQVSFDGKKFNAVPVLKPKQEKEQSAYAS